MGFHTAGSPRTPRPVHTYAHVTLPRAPQSPHVAIAGCPDDSLTIRPWVMDSHAYRSGLLLFAGLSCLPLVPGQPGIQTVYLLLQKAAARILVARLEAVDIWNYHSSLNISVPACGLVMPVLKLVPECRPWILEQLGDLRIGLEKISCVVAIIHLRRVKVDKVPTNGASTVSVRVVHARTRHYSPWTASLLLGQHIFVRLLLRDHALLAPRATVPAGC